jgi:hypothetical protein
MTDDAYERGMKVRREVPGDEHVGGSAFHVFRRVLDG